MSIETQITIPAIEAATLAQLREFVLELQGPILDADPSHVNPRRAEELRDASLATVATGYSEALRTLLVTVLEELQTAPV